MVPVSSRVRIGAVFVLIILLAGCIFSPDKPHHGDDPPPGVPAITWISVSEGASFDTRNITVSWKGNEYSRRYRFTLDDAASTWLDSASITLSNLANGAHAFSVQAVNDSLSGDIKTVHFTVNSAEEPGIRFTPDTISGVSIITVSLENMSGIMAAHIEIACRDTCARLREFTAGADISGGDVFVLSDSRDTSRLILDIGFPGRTAGFNGTLELGSFLVSPLKKEGVISIDASRTVFRDPLNRTLSIGRYDSLRIQP